MTSCSFYMLFPEVLVSSLPCSLYQSCSGQHFNLSKNQLFFGRCSLRCKVRIKDIIQVGASSLLVKYLGAPLLIDKTSKLHFFSLVGSLSSGVRSVSPNLRVA